MSKSICIYHLYPELLNLYGDKGNAAVLKMRAEKRGIEAVVKEVGYGTVPDFSEADIVILGGGADRQTDMVAELGDALAVPLAEYVNGGGVLLALCEGACILQRLGILDIGISYADDRIVGNACAEAELDGQSVLVVGFENHASRIDIRAYEPFGRVVFGGGNDGSGKYEGLVYKNAVVTQLSGPILPKSPELADYLIKTALQRKYKEKIELCGLDDSAELLARTHIVEKYGG